jgi:hypothetical protein
MKQGETAMRTFVKSSWIVGVVLLAAACSSESMTETATAPKTPIGRAAIVNPTPGTCTTAAVVNAEINTVFGSGSANATSAAAAFTLLNHYVLGGNFAAARTSAFDLVKFILDKYKLGGLPGSTADVVSLVNHVFCFAGLGLTISDPTNSWLVYPSDGPQTLVTGNGLAGTALPGAVVTEPTLITITQLTGPGVPGAGPLDTKLDQYPYFFEFFKGSATDAPLTQQVVVGVCPAPEIPSDVLARLRLGHDASAGFEITPQADASFLTCPTSTASSAPKWLRTLASLVLPAKLSAKARIGGGVGGTAGEFSPFAPVDPNVALTGGVGGTAGQFLRGSLLLATTCTPTEALINSQVDPACRPGVKLQTKLGTLLQNVPVTFGVTVGGGTVAEEQSGVCSTFAALIVATTGSNGKAGACWILGGTAGTNTVVASPGVGGDVPSGVTFTPSTVTFNATATLPPATNVINSCAIGKNGDPINAAGKTIAFWMPNPGANRVIREIELYFSSSGKANVPTTYQIQLTTQAGSFNPSVAPPAATAISIVLRGNNSENKAGKFVLPTPITGSTGGPAVMVQLRVLTNPDGSTITMNSGPCSLGTNCKPPLGCNVTEVNSLTPYPTGTAYRKSVGMTVRGD